MDLKELKLQIKQNKLNNIYVFTGTEIAIKNIFIEQISKVTNLPIIHISSALNYYNTRLKTAGLLQKNSVYVIYGDIDYLKQDIKVLTQLVEGVKKSGDIVIFNYTVLDKRGKFYKFFEQYTVDFVKLSDSVLASYLKKDYNIPQTIAIQIVQNCCNDYTACCLEAKKLLCYAALHNIELIQAYSQLTQSHLMTQISDSDILNKFLESVLEKDLHKQLKLSSELDIKTDPPLKVIAYLYNKMKALFAVVAYESGLTSKKNESAVNFYAIQSVQIFSPQWSISQVRNVMAYLQNIEFAIKTGRFSTNEDNVWYNICSTIHVISNSENW